MNAIIDQMKANATKLNGLNAKVAFKFSENEGIYLDGSQNPPIISEFSNQPSDCAITVSKEDLMKLIEGKLDPMYAFALGKIKVAGSMGVAMKLSSLLGD